MAIVFKRIADAHRGNASQIAAYLQQGTGPGRHTLLNREITWIGGSHMSRTQFAACRAALGLGTAAGAAAVAAFLSMGTAHAIPGSLGDADGYSDLFGETNLVQAFAQGADDAKLDNQLFLQDPNTALSFDQSVDSFESANVHPIADLVYALDPNAFFLSIDPDITGTLNAAGDYLVPADSLGYLATGIDYFLLNPTGLGFLFSPVIEILAGSPPF